MASVTVIKSGGDVDEEEGQEQDCDEPPRPASQSSKAVERDTKAQTRRSRPSFRAMETVRKGRPQPRRRGRWR
jgi:hypothetical protein